MKRKRSTDFKMFQKMNNCLRSFCHAAMILGLLGGVCHAADPITPPPGGTDVVTFDEATSFTLDTKGTTSSQEWVPAGGIPIDKAYRVNLIIEDGKTEQVQVEISPQQPIPKGNTVLLSFWVRRPKSGGEPAPSEFQILSGSGKSGSGKPNSGKPSYEYKFSVYRDWQQHVRAFTASTDIDPERTNIRIHVSNSGKAVDIAGLRLIDYGPDYDIETLPESSVTYEGRDPDAQWRKDALARIEKIRKGDLTIEVVDANGNPVNDATIKVEMQRHAFGFGNVVNSNLLGGNKDNFPYTKKRGSRSKTSSWEDSQKYREIVKEYFNVVTFESELRPHVWKGMMGDTTRGADMRKIFFDQALPWLKENDIGVRGHYIAWGAIDYNASEKQFVGNPEGHRQWLWTHMSDVLPKSADFVTEWDTINHIIGWGKHTYEKEYGSFDIYADIMAEARRLAPDANHSVNEGKVLPDGYKRGPYKNVIRFLNENGQAPDTVGFMAHFELTSLTPPEELLEVYDDFAEVAPRMQLSEFDVDAGDDEQLQADFFRDVMIASFSHPNFVSIVQWGFWENAHWKSAAALWRGDWSIKPSGQVFVDLVKNQWWTDETATTNADGQCELRGFLGDYKLTVDHDGQTITKKASLVQEGTHIQIQINSKK